MYTNNNRYYFFSCSLIIIFHYIAHLFPWGTGFLSGMARRIHFKPSSTSIDIRRPISLLHISATSTKQASPGHNYTASLLFVNFIANQPILLLVGTFFAEYTDDKAIILSVLENPIIASNHLQSSISHTSQTCSLCQNSKVPKNQQKQIQLLPRHIYSRTRFLSSNYLHI